MGRRVEREVARTARSGQPIAIAAMDLDLFKAVKTIYPTRRVEIIKSKVEPVAAPVDTA